MEGDMPSELKEPANEARPPAPPGTIDPREPIGDVPPCPAAGAAFRKPLIPGTAAATLLKFSGLNLLLANPKMAPAPPVACALVTPSCWVSWPTSSGLGFAAAAACACARAVPKSANTQAVIKHTIDEVCFLMLMTDLKVS